MQFAKLALLIYFVSTFTYTNGNRVEEVSVTVELLGMDIVDKCSALSTAQKNILLKNPNSRKQKIETEKSTASFIREESTSLKKMYDVSGLELPEVIERQWNIYSKIGDQVLPEENWNELVSFKNSNEELLDKLQVSCYKNKEKCTIFKKDVLKSLATSRDPKELKYMWSASQDIFTIYRKQFPHILKLTEKAAQENDEENVRKYWEMLVEYPDAYDIAHQLWTEIEPLYTKFHKFVKTRLEQHYSEIKNSDTIPVYLLGSEFGTDWSNIAALVLPHRYLYDEINSMLEFDNIGGKKVYEIADKFTNTMGFDKAKNDFWSNSAFDQQCPSQLLNNYADRYSYAITCNATGWIEYLNAHEDMMENVLNNINYAAATYNSFRLSALDESLASLGNLLALRNLPMAGIVPEDVFFPPDDDSTTINNNEMTALFLAALRILPRLPYYLLSDTWRLELLENEEEITANKTVEKWWELRESMQKVRGVTNAEFDFLGDPYIVSNKPYIGKFFGNIIQFQILEYFQKEVIDGVNILTHIADSEEFGTLLKHRAIYDWPKVLSDNFYYDIASDSLLEYFKPLEEYMDNAPVKQVTQTVRPKTTTTTTAKTTTPDQVAITSLTNDEPQHESDSIPNKQKKIESRNPELQDSVTKLPAAKNVPTLSSGNSKSIKKQNPTLAAETETPTSSSSTATWIGTLIGIGALSVIIIIFARKRCRRKPVVTNRRNEV